MSKRRRWILGFSIGVPVGLAIVLGSAVIVLRLTAPEAAPLDPVQPKEIPIEWESPTDPVSSGHRVPTNGSPDGSLQTSSIAAPPTLAFATDGSLTMLTGDRPFGEETYRITLEDDGLTLTARGRFYFKVLVATVNVAYEQTLRADSSLSPAAYSASFQAPFGRSESIDVRIEEGHATITRGEEIERISLPAERVFVLGTFSSYALVPLAYSLWQTQSRVSADVLVFGGPPSQDDASSNDEFPRITIEQLSDEIVEIDGQSLQVDRYLVSSSLGDGVVLAKGFDFLGFISGSGHETLQVYRSDYFPNGLFVTE